MAIVIASSQTSGHTMTTLELWEDREIKFDVPVVHTKMRIGEKVIDRLDFIEDTKGNPGDKGRLIITNLRIIWYSLSIARISLSIGLNCIISATTKVVNSKLKGTTEALHIIAKSNNSRFEFIFTNLVSGNTRHFISVMGVHKAYLSSKTYRELKLRGAIVREKQLRILPLEKIYTTVPGVWNLSSEQGNLGSFILTNVRIVWFAEMNENFNISLPYLQISSIKIRDSRFGPALVVESRPASGGYVLGFMIDTESKLHQVTKEISSLYKIHNEKPEFGVEYIITDLPATIEEAPIGIEEVQEIDETDYSVALSAYYEEGSKTRHPVFCPQLGLAVEEIKPGFTIESLWQVISPNKAATPVTEMVQNREERLRKKREAEKRRQQRIALDPNLMELEKEKIKNKYENRKKKKQIKLINDQTPREKKITRKNWRQRAEKFRDKKKKCKSINNSFCL